MISPSDRGGVCPAGSERQAPTLCPHCCDFSKAADSAYGAMGPMVIVGVRVFT
jgi:hypothetical protein